MTRPSMAIVGGTPSTAWPFPGRATGAALAGRCSEMVLELEFARAFIHYVARLTTSSDFTGD